MAQVRAAGLPLAPSPQSVAWHGTQLGPACRPGRGETWAEPTLAHLCPLLLLLQRTPAARLHLHLRLSDPIAQPRSHTRMACGGGTRPVSAPRPSLTGSCPGQRRPGARVRRESQFRPSCSSCWDKGSARRLKAGRQLCPCGWRLTRLVEIIYPCSRLTAGSMVLARCPRPQPTARQQRAPRLHLLQPRLACPRPAPS